MEHDKQQGLESSLSSDENSNGKPRGNSNATDSHNQLSVPMGPYRLTLHRGMTPRSASSDKESRITPRAVLHALRRRWFLALSLGLFFGTLAAAAAWLLIPAPYTAFSDLRINSVPERILFETSEAQPRFDTYKQTQTMLLKSPFVLNAALRQEGISELSLLKEAQEKGERPVDWLEKNIKTSSPATEFLRVSLSGDKPVELMRIVNSIVDAYVDEIVNADQKHRRDRLSQLDEIKRSVDDELRTKQNTLKQLAEQLKTADPETLNVKDQLKYEYYTKLRGELVQVRFDLMQAKITAGVNQSEQQVDSDEEDEIVPEDVLAVRMSRQPEFQRAKQAVEQLKEVVAQLEYKYGPNHPQLVAAQWSLSRREEKLENLRQALEQSVRKEIAWEMNGQADPPQLAHKIGLLERQKQEIETQLVELEADQDKSGLLAFELEAVRKEIAQVEQISTRIGDERERLKIELRAPARVLLHRKAEFPQKPELTKRLMMTGLSGFGVLGLFLAGIVWIELLSRRISSMDELTDELHLPVVGTLPTVPRSYSSAARNGSQQASWRNVLTESIDSTRTMILREAERRSLRMVMVTSAMSGEGKTTLSCHLATSLARSGRRSLLIDCDVRRPAVHRVFDESLQPGFCEAVRGEASLREVQRTTSLQGLTFIPGGEVDEKFLQLLAQDGADPLFAELREQFDLIILDSSPVLQVSDSLLIAQHADSVVFSIRRDISRVGKVAAAASRLAMLDIPIMGAVAIGLEEGVFGYSHYRYQYYQASPQSNGDGRASGNGHTVNPHVPPQPTPK